MDKDFIWTDDVDCAITVCDKEGKVLFQNKVSRGLFQRDGETMVGKSLMPCHSDHSRGLIGEMLATGNTHCYTITKKGRKKLVYQTPWKQDGEVAGLSRFRSICPRRWYTTTATRVSNREIQTD